MYYTINEQKQVKLTAFRNEESLIIFATVRDTQIKQRENV